MHASIYLILASLLLHTCTCSSSETCPANRDSSCDNSSDTDIYSKAANERYAKLLATIEAAEANYVECEGKKCNCFAEVITRDLKIFAGGIERKLIEAARPRGTFYQIINGELYREKNCMFPSRCAGVEHFLSKLSANTSDVSLVINVRDYPQSSKHFGEPLPVFSFSKTPQYYDIMYPAWAFWEGGPAISLYPRGLGRWDLHRKSLKEAGERVPWEDKETRAFFRGSRTSSERDNLVLLSRDKPHLVDAQYTKNQAWKSEKDTLHMPPAVEASLESHCSYKYLFNYRGVAASFRHKHLFLCGSLVFHVGDEWTEFYYDAMKPWIHYVPVPRDASQQQIEELIQFAKDNDAIAKRIAERGRDFVWRRLKLSDVTCFWKKLVRRYSKLFKYKPALEENLIKISNS
ncbi:O-glucosyltransferase rumi homolog [Copidosoma floridanum]|uniref:O-glucosyltransferase rumi homolog n=1 Tax=Copidosoma floridanum TaxID=29053 RepID=UPI0006C95AA5|nr:O-glucosyltransferase rumi homolog [Copidosoma floridanum]